MSEEKKYVRIEFELGLSEDFSIKYTLFRDILKKHGLEPTEVSINVRCGTVVEVGLVNKIAEELKRNEVAGIPGRPIRIEYNIKV